MWSPHERYSQRESPLEAGSRVAAEAARAELTVGDQVGLAFRAHRLVAGQSQRELASALAISGSAMGRLETVPGRLRFGRVLQALGPTMFAVAPRGYTGELDPVAVASAVSATAHEARCAEGLSLEPGGDAMRWERARSLVSSGTPGRSVSTWSAAL